MRSGRTLLPRGARIYLPDEAARKRHAETRLLEIFARWGYRELVTPTFEFFDVLAAASDQALQDHMFTMVDRETGRLLVLRPDITPQIARVVATRLRDEPKPLRLSYLTNVFRYEEPRLAHYREFYQAGVELMGLDKPEAEVEVLAMTVEGLQALGLSRFQIDVSHPDLFRGLLEEIGADPARAGAIREALGRKDLSTLKRLVGEIDPPAHVGDALLTLPAMLGREEVLERAAAVARTPRAERAVASLAEVYRLLRIYGLADSILLDLGEVRGFDYYSGLYFEAYVAGFGAAVAAGGRYDHMVSRFGYDCPAVGFAFDLARLLTVMEAQGVVPALPGPDFFIIDFTPEKTAALSLARCLRDRGASVARDIVSRGLDESLAYARAQRVGRVLVVGAPDMPAGQVRVLDLAGGTERALGVREILDAPGRLLGEMEHA